MPAGQPATRHTALSCYTARRRRCTHAGDRPACRLVRPLWVSTGHGVAQASRLAGGQGPRRAYLASRGVPQKQKPRGRLWLNDGWCVRPRSDRRNHVWSYDFVSARTHDGRSVRLLNLIDEHTRESLLVRAERRWTSSRVISALADVMVMKGVPEHLRSDNDPEFVAKALRKWLARTGAKTLYIEPGSPWENGYCESFNSKRRDEFLNGEIFYSIKDLRVLAECWRVHYNTIRPHSSLGYRSPAPEAWLTSNTRHGEVEISTRFPLPHTPDGGYLNSEIAALHQLFQRHKRSGTPRSCRRLTLQPAQK